MYFIICHTDSYNLYSNSMGYSPIVSKKMFALIALNQKYIECNSRQILGGWQAVPFLFRSFNNKRLHYISISSFDYKSGPIVIKLSSNKKSRAGCLKFLKIRIEIRFACANARALKALNSFQLTEFFMEIERKKVIWKRFRLEGNLYAAQAALACFRLTCIISIELTFENAFLHSKCVARFSFQRALLV